MAELSVAFSPPSLKLRRALLAIHPHGKPWGFLAKESKNSNQKITKPIFFPPIWRDWVSPLSSGKWRKKEIQIIL
jgi:hypothetical protein